MSDDKLETQVQKQDVHQIEILADGEMFILKVPVAVGKMGAYGALELMRDEVSKFYFIMEKRKREEEEKNKLLLSQLRIPGVRTQ